MYMQDTALHGLIQDCASTILVLFDTVLQQEPATGFIPDIASIRASRDSLHPLYSLIPLDESSETLILASSLSVPPTLSCYRNEGFQTELCTPSGCMLGGCRFG